MRIIVLHAKKPEMDVDPYINNLFKGYLHGNLSGEQELRLGEWLTDSDQNYTEFKKYLSENRLIQSYSDETNRTWRQVRQKTFSPKRSHTARTMMISGWLKIAALIIMAMVTGFYIHSIVGAETNRQAVLNEIIVQKGEKAQVILSDGTHVYLNSGSHFRYPATFSKKKRMVTLTGEAFFEVAKDKINPFIIGTPNFSVRVTGTSFNLMTYPDDAENSLTLHTGKVFINQGKQEYAIKPGEKYILETATGMAVIKAADLQKSILWKDGIIVIDSLDLGKIAKILERRFNVQITIRNENYKKIRYAGQFKPRETLEEILELIKKSSPVKFTYEINKSGTEIIIK